MVVRQLSALFLCLLLLTPAACNTDGRNATVSPFVSPLDPWQEKQVLYDLVLTTLHGDQAQLVVDELSHQFHQDVEQLAQTFPNANEATLRDFARANRQRQDLHPVFAREARITLIDRNAFLVEGSGLILRSFEFDRFQTRYPQAAGLILLSDIGFNQDHTEALVITELFTNDVSHTDQLFLLRKEAGQWTIVAQAEQQWIV